jgi:hypothetical protein
MATPFAEAAAADPSATVRLPASFFRYCPVWSAPRRRAAHVAHVRTGVRGDCAAKNGEVNAKFRAHATLVIAQKLGGEKSIGGRPATI